MFRSSLNLSRSKAFRAYVSPGGGTRGGKSQRQYQRRYWRQYCRWYWSLLGYLDPIMTLLLNLFNYLSVRLHHEPIGMRLWLFARSCICWSFWGSVKVGGTPRALLETGVNWSGGTREISHHLLTSFPWRHSDPM